VLDESTGTLFGGDLVFLDHIPVLDGSINGWLSLMPALAALPARRVVPGHGRRVGDWPQALNDEWRYLQTVQSDARRLITLGQSMTTALPFVGASERGHWALFDEYHLRNATTAFAELEWE
jgi:glyoxylase-like metal-dependent hydrolase (beta-lactamase superfamily II)